MAENYLMDSETEELKGSAALLTKALNMTIDKCLSSLKYPLFAVNYAAVKLHDSSLLKNIHKDMIAKLKENIQDELKLMMYEEKIPKLLGELDVLRKNAPVNCKVAWRPTRNPQNDVRVHIMKQKIEKKLLLKKLLLQEEQKYTELTKHIAMKRASLKKVQSHMEAIENNLKKIAEACPPSTIHQIESKVKTIINKSKSQYSV